jgi:hypothetical protein
MPAALHAAAHDFPNSAKGRPSAAIETRRVIDPFSRGRASVAARCASRQARVKREVLPMTWKQWT